MMLEAAVTLRVYMCVMTVRSLKASPTQASDNKKISAHFCHSLRTKVEDEEHNEKEETKFRKR